MESKKILLVEDDEFLREIYHDILKKAGYTVETAVDGEDALLKVNRGYWDLLLLDIVLPKIDGLELTKQIKSSNSRDKIKKIVFLTNLDQQDKLEQATALGDGYLIKNELNPDEFLKKVSSFLVTGQAKLQV